MCVQEKVIPHILNNDNKNLIQAVNRAIDENKDKL